MGFGVGGLGVGILSIGLGSTVQVWGLESRCLEVWDHGVGFGVCSLELKVWDVGGCTLGLWGVGFRV